MISTPVTIIGEPEVFDWTIALQVKCPCGHEFELKGRNGAVQACGGVDASGNKKCPKLYKISGLPVLQAHNVPGVAPVVISLDGATFAAGIAYGNLQQP